MGSGAYKKIAHQDLASVGLRKFVHELKTGRMIAFVGSGATRNHGYSGWDKTFVDNYRKAIAATVEDELATASEKKTFTEKNNIARAIIKGLKANKGEAPLKSDVALNLDLLENLYGITRLPEDAEEFQKVRKKFAELFNPQSFKDEESKPEKVPLEKDVLQSLFSQLLIRRIITLNYDVEAEIAFLRQVRKCSRNTAIKDLVREFETLPDDTIDLTLDLPNGYRLRSLIAERNKNDKLVEFALGAPDRTISILHLHGRYDQPNSLVVSKRDYRDLYWRKDLSKPLVEQGLKSVFIGNPILHIGIGMSEADVTRTLEQFMSDTPLDVEFPRFILKNTFATEPENEAFRLRMFHDFGVYTIFDTDVEHAYHGECAFTPKGQLKEKRSPDISKTLVQTLGQLQEITVRIGDSYRNVWTKDGFCNDNPQLGGPAGFPNGKKGIQIWEAALEDPIKQLRLSWPSSKDVTDKSQWNEASVTSQRAYEVIRKSLASDPLTVIVAKPGLGKGLVSRLIHEATKWVDGNDKIHRSVKVNAAFAMETDGIFSILTGIVSGKTAAERGLSRHDVMRQFLGMSDKDIRDFDKDPSRAGSLTIIVNGMERFLSDDGEPLSIEADNFLRQYALRIQSHESQDTYFRLVLVGTTRVQRYIDVIACGNARTYELRRSGVRHGRAVLSIEPREFEAYPLKRDSKDSYKPPIDIMEVDEKHINYFATLIEKTDERARRLGTASSAYKSIARRLDQVRSIGDKMDRASRSAVLMYLLSAEVLKLPSLARYMNRDVSVQLCLQIIRTLAFIGQPTDKSVFDHILDIIDFEKSTPEWSRRDRRKSRIAFHIEHLIRCGLILELAPFDRNERKKSKRFADNNRIALHKSVLAEMRERYGIPLSDARLTNSFNLTLYAAQPVEGYVPETRWHDIVQEIAGNLVNAYRDASKSGEYCTQYLKALRIKLNQAGHINIEKEHICRLATSEIASCLRAAYLMIRSYYSSTSMIMLTDQTGSPAGELKRLARRLKRLVDVAEQHAIIRDHIIEEVSKNDLDGEKLKDAQRELGKPPFYPDDLVWIYNEIGVIEMLLGRLYRSQGTLQKAHLINSRFVEFGKRNGNWRFIETNMLNVYLNRGRLHDMDTSLRNLRDSIEAATADFDALPPKVDTQDTEPETSHDFRSPLDQIVSAYGVRGGKSPARIDPDLPRDLILNTALYMGYRAIHETISGSFETASEYFKNSAHITNRIGERRAYSLFQRHHASLLNMVNREEDAIRHLQLAINASGSVRQADINRFSRTIELDWKKGLDGHKTGEVDGTAIPALKEILTYARRSDNYMLQIQALKRLAELHRISGDFDSAVAADTDAIALSSRFGHGLRKVSLRVALAKDYCLHQDDDLRNSAISFLETASQIGTKIGYWTLVERAQTTRVNIKAGLI